MTDPRRGPRCHKLMRSRQLCGRRMGHGSECRSKASVQKAARDTKRRYLLAHAPTSVQKVVMGPAPCQGCGRMLFWNGWEWKLWKGPGAGKHLCAVAA